MKATISEEGSALAYTATRCSVVDIELDGGVHVSIRESSRSPTVLVVHTHSRGSSTRAIVIEPTGGVNSVRLRMESL